MSYLDNGYLESTYLEGLDLSEEEAGELAPYLPDSVNSLMGQSGFLSRPINIPGFGPVTLKTIIIVAALAAGVWYVLKNKE